MKPGLVILKFIVLECEVILFRVHLICLPKVIFFGKTVVLGDNDMNVFYVNVFEISNIFRSLFVAAKGVSKIQGVN